MPPVLLPLETAWTEVNQSCVPIPVTFEQVAGLAVAVEFLEEFLDQRAIADVNFEEFVANREDFSLRPGRRFQNQPQKILRMIQV